MAPFIAGFIFGMFATFVLLTIYAIYHG